METSAINISIVRLLNTWVLSHPALVSIVDFFAIYAGWLLIAAILVYVYNAPTRFRAAKVAMMVLLSASLALALADFIKYLYPIARPYVALPGVKAVFVPDDYSAFPSGHAAFFGGLALSFYLREKKWGAYFIAVALAVMIARVAAGIHYPLDILGGILLATICSFGVYKLGKK